MTGAGRPTSRGRKLKSDNNVALGDILTLIFGFFVLMVTLNKFAIISDAGASTPASAKIARSSETGVSVPAKNVLTISEKDFLSIALGNTPLRIPESLRNNMQSVTVEACVSRRHIERDDQRLWERSAARAEKIGALLTSAGIPAERIAVRALGSHCDLIAKNNEGKQSVAIVLH